MVGGGKEAFIGAVHRIAVRIDAQFDLLAGALSSAPARSRDRGQALGPDPARWCYGSYQDMAEAARPDSIQAVSIVTSNHMHVGPAIEFLRRGIHVICHKPLSATMQHADDLVAAVRNTKALFILTHTCTGYQMVR